MNFRQRLLRYLVGVTIGCLIVYLMFPTHDWLGWTPGKQVMDHVRSSHFEIPPVAACRLKCAGLTLDDLQQARLDGDVVFSKSNTHQEPKVYHIEHREQYYLISVMDTVSRLEDVGLEGMKMECSCP